MKYIPLMIETSRLLMAYKLCFSKITVIIVLFSTRKTGDTRPNFIYRFADKKNFSLIDKKVTTVWVLSFLVSALKLLKTPLHALDPILLV